MGEPLEINIRLYLIIALGDKKTIHQEIDEMYEKNRLEYYEYYRKSDLFNDRSFQIYVIDKEERMKKVAGIVQWCYAHSNLEPVYTLIRHGFKFTWNFLKQRKNIVVQRLGQSQVKPIVFDDFAQALIKRAGGAEKITDTEIFNNECILMYLCHREGVPLDMSTPYGEFSQTKFRDYILNVFAKEIHFNDENILKHRNEIDQLYDEFYVAKRIKEIPLGMLLEEIVQAETEKLPIEINVDGTNFYKVRAEVFKYGIAKYIGAFSGWVKTCGINEMDITDTYIMTRRDIDEVFLEYLVAKKENQISESEKYQFVVATFFMKVIMAEYQRVKDIYFTQLQEDFFVEIKEMRDTLDVREKQLQQEQVRMESEKKTLALKIEQGQTELRHLQKENESMKNELLSAEEHRKEVHALREYLYSLEQIPSEIPSVDLVDMVNALNERKIAIVGGHPNWQQKVRETFPRFRVYHPDAVNSDLSPLDSMEAVFINTATFSHKFYERVMKQMSRNDAKLYYLNHGGNVHMSVREMHRLLSEE